MSAQTRLAVLGHPISHSLSPLLHRAAYAALGLPWTYEFADVEADALGAFLAARGPEWRGLSLTMPLKRIVLPLLDTRDELVELTGVANTVLFGRHAGRSMLHGYNTDVAGAATALRGADVRLNHVRVLGSGATAASVLVAIRRLGASSAIVHTRSPKKAGALRELAARIGLGLEILGLDAIGPNGVNGGASTVPDLVVSTLPGDSGGSLDFPEHVRRGALLFDVAYDPWPSPLAKAWQQAGGRVVTGLELLAQQALGQVRVFVNGDPESTLPDEAAVFAAMRASIGIGAARR